MKDKEQMKAVVDETFTKLAKDLAQFIHKASYNNDLHQIDTPPVQEAMKEFLKEIAFTGIKTGILGTVLHDVVSDMADMQASKN